MKRDEFFAMCNAFAEFNPNVCVDKVDGIDGKVYIFGREDNAEHFVNQVTEIGGEAYRVRLVADKEDGRWSLYDQTDYNFDCFSIVQSRHPFETITKDYEDIINICDSYVNAIKMAKANGNAEAQEDLTKAFSDAITKIYGMKDDEFILYDEFWDTSDLKVYQKESFGFDLDGMMYRIGIVADIIDE